MVGEYEIVCRGCGKTVTLVGLGVGRMRRYCGADCQRVYHRGATRVSQREHRERVAAQLERLAVLEELVLEHGLAAD